MHAFSCALCGLALHPGAARCTGCTAAIICGATRGELQRAAKIGASAVLAVWCYAVAYSPAAIVVGVLLVVASGWLMRRATAQSRALQLRTLIPADTGLSAIR